LADIQPIVRYDIRPVPYRCICDAVGEGVLFLACSTVPFIHLSVQEIFTSPYWWPD